MFGDSALFLVLRKAQTTQPNPAASGQPKDSLWGFMFHPLKLNPSYQVGEAMLPGENKCYHHYLW